jgi:hypothetical protein
VEEGAPRTYRAGARTIGSQLHRNFVAGVTDVYPYKRHLPRYQHINTAIPPSSVREVRAFLDHNVATSAMTQHPPRTSSLPRQRDGVQPQSLEGTAASDAPKVTAAVPERSDGLKAGPDVLSDKATAAFIRRTLCAQHALAGAAGRSTTPRPVDELLPPLTSSNEIDLQLYAILAVILKEFVYAWYSKITPDYIFVDEVIHIIAHCTRALEQRIRKVDLEAVLLDELPQLVDTHVKCTYRMYSSVLFLFNCPAF